MKRLNSEGAILALVLIILLLFTLLGYGLLRLSNVNAVEVNRSFQSSRAFWLAEAGIVKAMENLPSTDPIGENLGDGDYSVTTTLADGYAYRWNMDSTGTVNVADRTIRVIVGPPVGAAIISNGPVETDLGNPTINGPVLEYQIFNFEQTFGKTEGEVRAMATHIYTDPPNNPGTEDPLLYPIDGITFVDMTSGGTLGLTSTGWSGTGLLVVNGDVSVKGGTFTGILWVNGNLTVSAGNALINGSIFINGDIEVETKVTGTPVINYDPEAVDDVYEGLGYAEGEDGAGYPLVILSWQEI